jgi:polar amino acid transport system permease protein
MILGLGLLAKPAIIRYPLFLFVDIVRSLPILILILWVYYFVPVLFGRPEMSSYTLACIALVLNLSAFVADVVRASVGAFPKGLLEAAYACGLSRAGALRRIVIPYVLREILPTLSLLYIDMLKLTSLASVIAVYELLHTADKIRSVTFRAIEVFTVVAAIYLMLVMPFSALVRLMERSRWFARHR